MRLRRGWWRSLQEPGRGSAPARRRPGAGALQQPATATHKTAAWIGWKLRLHCVFCIVCIFIVSSSVGPEFRLAGGLDTNQGEISGRKIKARESRLLSRGRRWLRVRTECVQRTAAGAGWRSGSGNGPAGDGAALIDVGVGGAPVDVVEGVEAVGPQLEGDPFTDEEVLLNGEVRIEEVRTEGGVAPDSCRSDPGPAVGRDSCLP